ncbi:1-aminocyclopropane-1-carboxylate synthase-like protein 1 [Hydractinia symbiolongicarpus]|uniref:1-aminocyclopropane-1-carboxylate synthase-like protein 1 n=1 Tax=Hydractinia symbiolongicarpus TaxID=13093 RepID=UPI00254BC868|nr:1-aminocyclopropane-1-carboxylate synthase-like protein 1 [Hydractinia symbiolongicarpus]
MFSQRIQRACNLKSFLVDALEICRANAYDARDNPRGIINLGTAENKIIYDIIGEKLSEVDMKQIPEKYSHYCNFCGNDEFRDKLASMFNHYMKPKLTIKRENLFVTNGGGPAVECLGIAFCDKHEGFLTPAPYYGAFYNDLRQRSETIIYPAQLSSKSIGSGSYNMTTQDLEFALEEAKQNGVAIKALLITNPYNPLGTIFSLKELEAYAQFCLKHNIHFICDEIYYFSVFDEEASMKSILSLPNFAKYKDIIHVIWAFSKDFGLSGYRCGVIISYNDYLLKALGQISIYTTVPTVAQYALESIVSDFNWIDRFNNQNHERLKGALRTVTKTLDDVGVKYIKPSGGFFIWLNLSNYLKSDTEEDEKKLYELFMQNGLYIAPGFAFYSREHGWFRVVFSIDGEQLKLALKRFAICIKTLDGVKKVGDAVKKLSLN